MFKKTLIAVAVMVGVTAPAFADVSIENANTSILPPSLM